jgi:hypothetical protein
LEGQEDLPRSPEVEGERRKGEVVPKDILEKVFV